MGFRVCVFVCDAASVSSQSSGTSAAAAAVAAAVAAIEGRWDLLESSWQQEQQQRLLLLLQQEETLAEALTAAAAALEADADAAAKFASDRAGDLFRQIETQIKLAASQLAAAASQEIAAYLASEAVEDSDPKAHFFARRYTLNPKP